MPTDRSCIGSFNIFKNTPNLVNHASHVVQHVCITKTHYTNPESIQSLVFAPIASVCVKLVMAGTVNLNCERSFMTKEVDDVFIYRNLAVKLAT
ncbi:MAG: hypothetical protein AMXMBFR82_00810 [Candidatus Hydrogenedentota bacterium]